MNKIWKAVTGSIVAALLSLLTYYRASSHIGWEAVLLAAIALVSTFSTIYWTKQDVTEKQVQAYLAKKMNGNA